MTGSEAGWYLWGLFCAARGRSPWLVGTTGVEAREEEEALLDFVECLARRGGYSAGSIWVKLVGIRYAHFTLGLPEPTA